MRALFKGMILLGVLIGVMSISNKGYQDKIKSIDWARVATK